jgi:hypothetical protein
MNPAACSYLPLLVAGLGACVAQSWTIPEGAPESIVEACRGEVMANSADEQDPFQQQRNDMPGVGDDLMHDAMTEKRAVRSGLPPDEVLFYQCLESNGVTLEPEQLGVIDDWLKR